MVNGALQGKVGIAGNVDATYRTTDGEPLVPLTDTDGVTITAEKNFSGGQSFNESVGTSWTSLSSHSVPDGAGVLVKNSLKNDDTIEVRFSGSTSGWTYAQGGSNIFLVDDTSEIEVKASSGTQIIEYGFEGEQ